jgi:hypothetical protein
MEIDFEEYFIPNVFRKNSDSCSSTSTVESSPLSSPTNKKGDNVKTELCKNWSEKENCPYGLKCRFAHGKAELKEKTHKEIRYKTKKCTSFYKKGYCQYNIRCKFIHGVDITYRTFIMFNLRSLKPISVFKSLHDN